MFTPRRNEPSRRATPGKSAKFAADGGLFAPRRKPLVPADAEKKASRRAEQQRPVKMKKTIRKEVAPGIKRAPISSEHAATQELIAPHEWQALLNSFENESAGPDGRMNSPTSVESQNASDVLWERLSSTRWLKVRPNTDSVGNRSTVAQRP